MQAGSGARGGGPSTAASGALDALPQSLKDLRLSNEAQHRDGKEPVCGRLVVRRACAHPTLVNAWARYPISGARVVGHGRMVKR